MAVEEHKIWGHFVSGNDVLFRQLCQHPNLLATLQGACGFVGNTLAQQIVGELECFLVLHDAIAVRHHAENGIIGAADIGTIAGDHSSVARVDVTTLDLPIQASQFQGFTACRGFHNDAAKAMPRGLTDRKHDFNICRHNKFLLFLMDNYFFSS